MLNRDGLSRRPEVTLAMRQPKTDTHGWGYTGVRDTRQKMTFKRGMRRLALFVGVLGAVAGGLASYFDLQGLFEQGARHKAFEQLANSDVVQQERKQLQNPRRFVTDPKTGVTFDISKATPILSAVQIDPASGERVTPPKSTGGWVTSDSPVPPPPPGFIPLDHSDVHKGGIKSIFWANNYEVKSLETDSGQTLVPEPAPNLWLYLLASTFPLLGFLVPWGLISALIWVWAGFAEAPK